jgi:hypothetical protein
MIANGNHLMMNTASLKASLFIAFGLLTLVWCSICPHYTSTEGNYWSAPVVNPNFYYQIDFGKFVAGEIFIASILTAIFILGAEKIRENASQQEKMKKADSQSVEATSANR